MQPFLTVLGWLIRYDFDHMDWDAISAGILKTSEEDDQWYEYVFVGEQVANFKIAHEDGCCLYHIVLEAPAEIIDKLELAISMLNEFKMTNNFEKKTVLKRKIRSKGSEIRTILNSWAPLGFPTPDDEYDCLVYEVLGLLKGSCTEADVEKILIQELSDHFGIKPPTDTSDIAKRLYGLKGFVHKVDESNEIKNQ